MALTEYPPGTTFPGVIGRTIGESTPAWPRPNRATDDAPNVVFIVLDDTGLGHLGGCGSRWPGSRLGLLRAPQLRGRRGT